MKDAETPGTSGRDPDRFYCPYPGCNRSFAELWRLKVHYRAPPGIQGSGKERGHGTELTICPKCKQTLAPGKHHVGCAAGKTAPRQANKRSKLENGDNGGRPVKPQKTGPSNPAWASMPQTGRIDSLAQQNFNGMAAPPLPAAPLLPVDRGLQHHPGYFTDPGSTMMYMPQQLPMQQAPMQHFFTPPPQPQPEIHKDIFEEIDNPEYHRVPSPPPLPPDFDTGPMLFNFAQFSQKMPSHQPPLPADQHKIIDDLSAGGLNLQESIGVYDFSDNGDLLQLLFGEADALPTMATIHLHKFMDSLDSSDSGNSPSWEQQQQQQQQQHNMKSASSWSIKEGFSDWGASEDVTIKQEMQSGLQHSSCGPMQEMQVQHLGEQHTAAAAAVAAHNGMGGVQMHSSCSMMQQLATPQQTLHMKHHPNSSVMPQTLAGPTENGGHVGVNGDLFPLKHSLRESGLSTDNLHVMLLVGDHDHLPTSP